MIIQPNTKIYEQLAAGIFTLVSFAPWQRNRYNGKQISDLVAAGYDWFYYVSPVCDDTTHTLDGHISRMGVDSRAVTEGVVEITVEEKYDKAIAQIDGMLAERDGVITRDQENQYSDPQAAIKLVDLPLIRQTAAAEKVKLREWRKKLDDRSIDPQDMVDLSVDLAGAEVTESTKWQRIWEYLTTFKS
jgi:hypothetical protein